MPKSTWQQGSYEVKLVTGSNETRITVEVVPQPTRYYYVVDHLGSVQATVDEHGEVVSRADYYPFGLEMAVRTVVGDVAVKENYTGHEKDDETGLVYAGARYLDPTLGRWMSVDPLADDYPEWSPYNYVLNNPLLLVDPTGMAAEQGGCPPNCSFEGMLRAAFGWAEPATNRVAQNLEDTRQAAGEVISDMTETVVKEGPEVLDAVTYAASGTAVAAGGAALLTGGPVPTPDDAIHATVAGVAAGVATISNTAATTLSVVDATHYGGDAEEATIRSYTFGIGISVGGIAGGIFSGILNRSILTQVQRAGAATATGTAAGSAASEAAKELLEEEQR